MDQLSRLGAPMAYGDLRLEPLAEGHRFALKAACAEDLAIWPIYAISAVAGEGCRELMHDVQAFLDEGAAQASAKTGAAVANEA